MYKADQIYILEQLFSRTQYPDADTVDDVARRVGISDAKIKVRYPQTMSMRNISINLLKKPM